jgi:hypothetical protein
MSLTTRRWMAPVSVAVLMLGAAGPGGAHEVETGQSDVHDLAATVSGTQVSVSGHAAFGGQALFQVGEDAVGDNLGADTTGTRGLDFEKLFISQPDPSKADLQFTIDLAGLQGGGIPETFQYNWDVSIDGGAPNGTNWSIKTMRSQARVNQNLNPYAAIFTCTMAPPPQTGFTCAVNRTIPVVYDEADGRIRLTVPLAGIKATPGSTIDAWARNGEPVWVRTSAAGAQTGFVTADDMTHDTYTVPKGSVQLALAPAGTPEGNVDFSKAATLAANGNFTGSLTAPGPGSYDVWAKACFAENCGTASTSVTIA